ncbi:hypothetical protein MNB_SV-4-918 [hydrothermal vent metagenome]|uniref:FMN-binding domain-containing protein n=1 Tax=hydrothermal vent metagenome TaxID=652676 RepID=A0A1W1E9F5_9ZZZZ
MMKKMIVALVVFALGVQTLEAKANVKVEQAVKGSFPNVDSIEPKQLTLTETKLETVQKAAKAKLGTKVYRYYLFKHTDKTVGYGVLIARKVRTKKATVLYAFTPEGTLKFAEIMVFGEPPEYTPNDSWMGQFRQKSVTAPLKMGSDVSAISGATLSARSITDGARVARAIFQYVIKP